MRSLLVAILLAATAQVAQAQDNSFEYHGYLRSGVGMSRGGTDQVCFTPAGVSNGVKFRLGNECETYLEVAFAKNVKVSESANAPAFKTHILLAGVSGQRHDWESTSDGQFTLAMREAYVQASNVLGSTKPWVGKRFYRRQDIHILDYYIINNSGPGAGFEDIDAGMGKLHVAVTRNVGNDKDTGARLNDPAQTNVDLRLSDIGLAGGKLETLLIHGASGERGSQTGDKSYEKLSGWQLGLVHGFDMSHGNNRLTLQHGRGVFGGDATSRGERLTAFGPAPAIAKGNSDAADAVNDSSSTRLVEEYTANFGPAISSSWVLLYQTTDFGGAKDATGDDAPAKSELMLGTRPVYHLSKTAAVALEYGFTSVGNAYLNADGDYDDTSMHKLTLAPQFSAGDGFWARPQLRFFVTYAQWNDEAKGVVADNSPYDADTTGFSTGAQLEAWW